MKMRELLSKLDAIDTPVNEAASMNINMTADDCNEVGELMKLMSNAGLTPKSLSATKKDDPKIPGKDDVEGDKDLQAGLIGGIGGSLGGSALGTALGGPVGGIVGSIAGGALGDKLTGDGLL